MMNHFYYLIHSLLSSISFFSPIYLFSLFIDESKLNEQSLKHLGINEDTNIMCDSKSTTTSSPSSSTRSSPSVRSANNNGGQQSPQSMIITKEHEITDQMSMSLIEIHPYESIAEFIRSFVSINPSDKIWVCICFHIIFKKKHLILVVGKIKNKKKACIHTLLFFYNYSIVF